MTVTIYCLGDLDTIRSALTAVAMLFNPGNTEMLAGTGPLGLGFAAGLGLLISLVFSSIGGLIRQRFEPQTLFVVMLTSAITFGPKTTVAVEDIFSGRSAVVDEIPIGVAYAGGILSSLMRSVTLNFDTALRTADAQYSSLTEFGLVNPLKMILAVRNGLSLQPAISKTFNHYLDDCIRDGILDDDIAAITSPIDVLENPMPERATLIFDRPDGRLAGCDEAANWLGERIDVLPTTVQFRKQLQRVAGRNPSRHDGEWDGSDPQVAISMLTGAAFDAHQAMLQLMAADIMYDSFQCGRSTLPGYINCTASLRQATEQYKADAGGRASAFARTMIPTMNVLMFMFYAATPLVALVVMLSGMYGVTQVLPKYLLFGVWSQSWMPIAAIINYFIQKQISEYFSAIDTSSGIRLPDAIALFDQVGLKVAAAADMLAATPMVTFALLSGSMFALSQLAGRSADKFDEKYSAPDIRKTGAATEANGQAWSQTPVGPMAAGAPQPFSLRMGESTAMREAVSEVSALGQSRRLMESASERHASTLSAGISGRISSVNSAFSELSKGRESGTAFKVGDQVSRGMSMSLSDSDQKVLDLDFQKSLAALTSAATMEGAAAGLKGDKLAGFVKNSAGKFLSSTLAKLGKAAPAPKIQEAFRTALDESIGSAFTSNKEEVDSWSTRFASGQRSTAESAFEKSYRQGWDTSSGTELAQATEDSRRREKSAQSAQERAASSGLDKVFTPQEIAAAAGPGLGFAIWGEAELAKLGIGGSAIQQEMQSLERRGILAGSHNAQTDLNRRNVAIAQLLAKNGQGAAVIQQLATRDHWKFEAPEPSAVQRQSEQIHGQIGDVGLSPSAAGNVEQRAATAQDAGQHVQRQTASVPQQVQQTKGEAQRPVAETQFDTAREQQHAAANANGEWNQNVQQALESAFPADVVQTMNHRRDQWKGDHGFKSLGEKLGHDIKNDPGAQALVAAVGLAAAAPVLEKAASMGAAGARYVGRVLSEVGKRSAPVVARAVARHGAATAAMAVPVAGMAVGAAVNVGLIGLTAYEGVKLVQEAMNAVDKESDTHTASSKGADESDSPIKETSAKTK